MANGNTNVKEYYFSFPLKKTDTGLANMEKGDSLVVNIKRIHTDVGDTYEAALGMMEFGAHGFPDAQGEAGFSI